MNEGLRKWARTIKRDVHALYLCSRDPRVPWYAKALAIAVAGYALSPIDLIPDFIPVLGYLDDVIILPLGILLAVRLIPPDVLSDKREATSRAQARPVNRNAAIAIIFVWAISFVLLSWAAYLWFGTIWFTDGQFGPRLSSGE